MKDNLLSRIHDHTAVVAVVGLGYVGLPLAVAFAERGFPVVGIDVDPRKIDSLNSGESYVQDIPSPRLAALIAPAGIDGRRSPVAGRLYATTDYAVLEACDAAIICVPTPLNKTRDPDVRYLISAGESVARYIHPGMLVSLESTTYPGTTEELLLPMLEAGMAKRAAATTPSGPRIGAGQPVSPAHGVGTAFFRAFSPERIDPGRQDWTVETTPKVVGGVTSACRAVAVALYSQAVQKVVPVSSTQTAEMVKLLENTFRAVNIALVNETAIMCDKLGIDVWEVIEAAASKPFGFMPFYPGPGLGGHCIPIDPFYLSWKTKQAGIEARFIELAGHINGQMPHFVVDKIQSALNDHSKPVRGSRIHIMGVAYKKDIDDVRESPALDIILMLQKRGAQITYTDPHVPVLKLDGAQLCSQDALASVAAADCAVIVTDHSAFDYPAIVERARLIVDTRNALKGLNGRQIVTI